LKSTFIISLLVFSLQSFGQADSVAHINRDTGKPKALSTSAKNDSVTLKSNPSRLKADSLYSDSTQKKAAGSTVQPIKETINWDEDTASSGQYLLSLHTCVMFLYQISILL